MASNQLATIYLLHGRGGWPGGSVLLLEELLRKSYPEVRYVRPSLPHGRENGVQPAERSLEYLRALSIERAALVIGVSLGAWSQPGCRRTGGRSPGHLYQFADLGRWRQPGKKSGRTGWPCIHRMMK